MDFQRQLQLHTRFLAYRNATLSDTATILFSFTQRLCGRCVHFRQFNVDAVDCVLCDVSDIGGRGIKQRKIDTVANRTRIQYSVVPALLDELAQVLAWYVVDRSGVGEYWRC